MKMKRFHLSECFNPDGVRITDLEKNNMMIQLKEPSDCSLPQLRSLTGTRTNLRLLLNRTPAVALVLTLVPPLIQLRNTFTLNHISVRFDALCPADRYRS